jgi:hypothetical protein
VFQSLDFVYLPSRDVAGDITRFTDGMGGSLVFAIERFGTRVAMVELSSSPPSVLLAEHLEGEAPVLVFRVDDLEATLADLKERGIEVAARFGIPYGPGAELSLLGPQRVAVYELSRPEIATRLVGRRDF